jgi:hypothetical protein
LQGRQEGLSTSLGSTEEIKVRFFQGAEGSPNSLRAAGQPKMTHAQAPLLPATAAGKLLKSSTGHHTSFTCRDGRLLAGLSDEDLQATDLTCECASQQINHSISYLPQMISVIWDPDPHVPSPENAAAESLLFLHAQQAKANPGVCRSTHSSEPEIFRCERTPSSQSLCY